MALTRLLLVLRARWGLALLVTLLVTAAVAGVTALLPRTWSATAAVVLDVKSPDPVAGLVLPGMAVSGYMATQVEILQSERVARKAAARLSPEQVQAYRATWQDKTQGQGAFEPWLAEQLAATLEVRPNRESNVMTVSSTTPDAKLSADIANGFVQGYIDTTLELKVEPARQYNSFFDQQAKALRENLDAAQARLTAFQRESGITASDERIDVETARLGELATQLVALQGASGDTGSRVAEARSSPDRMQEVLDNGVIAGLTADLARQEARLDEMLARLGEQHPQVVQLRANIDQLKSRIRSETDRLVASIGVSDSVNRSRVEKVRSAVEAQRAKVMQLRSQRDRIAVLAKDVENAQHAFDAVYTRQSQTRVESQLTQTNVSVLKEAVPALRPARPRVLLHLALGLTLGALLGLGASLLREALNPVLRHDDDVLQDLGVPLLERVPALPLRRRRRAATRLLPAWMGRATPRTA